MGKTGISLFAINDLLQDKQSMTFGQETHIKGIVQNCPNTAFRILKSELLKKDLHLVILTDEEWLKL